MESRPPEVIERVIGLLIPPACREAVLGDLSERYRSRGEYVRKAVRTVPLVIGSQIRRTFRFQYALSEFCALYVAFYLAALRASEYAIWLRLSIPALAGAFGLILQRTYSVPGVPSPRKSLARAAVGASFASISQVILVLV